MLIVWWFKNSKNFGSYNAKVWELKLIFKLMTSTWITYNIFLISSYGQIGKVIAFGTN